MKQERIAWVDSFRFLGMLAIYIGHFGEAAGKLYQFVYLYHVPLFFFAAGFFAGKPGEGVLQGITSLARRLMLPYVFFALLFLVTYTLFVGLGWPDVQAALIDFALGIRNNTPAGSLWFIPCLFVVAVAHLLVRRVARSALVPVALGIFGMYAAQRWLHKPSWVWNVDSAAYYFGWYAIGHAVFPALVRAVGRPWFAVATSAAAVAGIALYFGSAAPIWAWAPSAVRFLVEPTVAAVLLLANIAVAQVLARIEWVRALGRRTLVLCGTENTVKLLIPQTLLLVGLKVQPVNALMAVGYSLVCMLVSGVIIAKALEQHAPRWTGLLRPAYSKS
jgi:fucose 4-O-acetylase-like acetyltransferase